MLKVIKPGLFSTVQDMGRFGHQQYGVIASGVMDRVAFRIGNALLKQCNKAAIEMTMIGGTFEFQLPTAIVLTGGMMRATVNHKPVAMNTVIPIQSGDLLTCGAISSGSKSYLCIAGGFLVEEILGSRSTYIKAGFGGFYGRALQQNDLIPFKGTPSVKQSLQVRTADFYRPVPT